MKTVKIANGQGFWGDSIKAPINLIKNGHIDYLTLDYLAEITLSIMQKQKMRNPLHGYALDFIDLFNSMKDEIIKKNIKIITNAGGVNPIECSKKIKKIISKKNKNYKVGIIKGDDILSQLDNIVNSGVDLSNLDTGEPLSLIRKNICSANVYIDSFTIKEALDKGANMVLAGRVTDPGLTVGPLLHEFNWTRNQYNKIASGTLAGHIIECGAQCTGGNFTKWMDVNDMHNIGYPIVSIDNSGTFDIIKAENTGGLINKFTISEQLLYELGDPCNYISPDVVVDFTSIKLSDLGNNKVFVSNVKGKKPTNTYKVSINYHKGYKAIGQLTVSGPNALKKAELINDLIWTRLSRKGIEFYKKNTDFIGYNSCHKNLDKLSEDPSEIVIRIGVMDKNQDKVNEFGKEIAPLITNGPPGVTGFAGGRPKAQEVIAYWPALIDKSQVKTKVDVF